MSFLGISKITTICTSNIKKGYALRTSPRKSNIFPNRTSPDILHNKKFFQHGSITVEVSLAVPLFLFFVINLCSMFDILAVHVHLEAALHQTAREMAVYGHAINQADKKEILSSLPGSVVFSETYVRQQVNKIVGQDYLNHSCIKNGSSGIIYSFSKIMKDDRIELTAVYRVEPKIPYIGFKGFPVVTSCKARAFTGYDNTKSGKNETGEQIVYIAETGEVYHFSKSCTHLQLSISKVRFENVKGLRNEGGEKYRACEKCGKNPGSMVYITKEGNRYHTAISCSGLKRTIDSIPISKVGDRKPCSRCGS